MADFDVEISQGADIETWLDTETPSRINPLTLYPHRHYRVMDVADPVRFEVAAEGVGRKLSGSAPWDWELKGRLIRWAWVESFGGPNLPIPTLTNRSAVVEFTGAAFRGRVGHHLLMAYRADGGSVAIPFLVTDTPQIEVLENDAVLVTDSVAGVLL